MLSEVGCDGSGLVHTCIDRDVRNVTRAAKVRGTSREQAFRALFEAEIQYLWNTLRYLGVRDADVRDVAHDVFVTVFKRFDECDPSQPLRSWLFVIAYHAASNYRRLARHRREVAVDEMDQEDQRGSMEEELDTRRQVRLLLRALEGMALEKRAVLVMHDIDGKPVPQVAEALSIPLNTAYSRLRLARRELESKVRALQSPAGA